MEVKELKINNIVSIVGQPSGERFNYSIPSGQSIDMIFVERNNHYPKPIPLTEEWLVKFGFVKDEYDWCSICFFTDYKELAEKMTISINLKSYRCAMFENEDESACYTSKIMKHVHQLQNLYFALTNEELTINQ